MVEEFIDIKKSHVFLTPDQRDIVENNPARLTKEGCMKEVENWKRSSNKKVLTMYEVMLRKCKRFAKSGKSGNDLVFARDELGKPVWTGTLINYVELAK